MCKTSCSRFVPYHVFYLLDRKFPIPIQIKHLQRNSVIFSIDALCSKSIHIHVKQFNHLLEKSMMIADFRSFALAFDRSAIFATLHKFVIYDFAFCEFLLSFNSAIQTLCICTSSFVQKRSSAFWTNMLMFFGNRD